MSAAALLCRARRGRHHGAGGRRRGRNPAFRRRYAAGRRQRHAGAGRTGGDDGGAQPEAAAGRCGCRAVAACRGAGAAPAPGAADAVAARAQRCRDRLLHRDARHDEAGAVVRRRGPRGGAARRTAARPAGRSAPAGNDRGCRRQPARADRRRRRGCGIPGRRGDGGARAAFGRHADCLHRLPSPRRRAGRHADGGRIGLAPRRGQPGAGRRAAGGGAFGHRSAGAADPAHAGARLPAPGRRRLRVRAGVPRRACRHRRGDSAPAPSSPSPALPAWARAP